MTARILDGRAIAAAMRDEIAGEVAAFRHEFGHGPCLAIVRLGNDPASISYARQIDKSFLETGFGYQLEVLPGAGEGDANRSRNSLTVISENDIVLDTFAARVDRHRCPLAPSREL